MSDENHLGLQDAIECRDLSLAQVERYIQMRLSGESHSMALILASNRFPGTKGTDRAFMQGRHLDGSQFSALPPWIARDYLAKARAAGVNLAGKYYMGGLAAFPGDPRAWVSDLSDLRRVARERNLEVHGCVDIKAEREPLPPPSRYQVADDIVQDAVANRIEAEPELAAKRPELIEEVRQELSGFHGTR